MKYRHPLGIFILLAVVGLLPIIAAAAPQGPPPDLVMKYSDLFAWAIGLGIFALCALVGYIAHSGNKNNERQWRKLDNHETRLSNLEGAHSVNHPGGRRWYDPDDVPDKLRAENDDPQFRRR